MTEAECEPNNKNIQNFTCICDGKNVTATYETKSNTNIEESDGRLKHSILILVLV